jgi:hypothetical protein
MKSIVYYLLNRDFLYTLCSDIKTIVGAHDLTVYGGLKTLYDEFIEAFERYSEAYNKAIRNPLTKDLKGKDELRDSIFLALRSMVEAFMHLPNEANQENAELIEECIRKHGIYMHKFGYNVQSARMDDMLSELTTAPIYTAATELNITSIIDDLNAAQQEFKQTAIEHAEFKSKNEDSTSGLRAEIIEKIKRMISLIDVLIYTIGDEALLDIENKLNNRIASIEQSARIRKTSVKKKGAKSKAAEKSDDPENPENPNQDNSDSETPETPEQPNQTEPEQPEQPE